MNTARERAAAILKTTGTAVLATIGPAGLQVGQFPCEAVELEIYLLVPATSEHLFNLERDGRAALHAERLELTGRGQAISLDDDRPQIRLLEKTGSEWCALVKVIPERMHVLRAEGWGPAETIDLSQPR